MRGRVRQMVAAFLGAAVGFAGITGTASAAHAVSIPSAALSAITADPASSTGAFSVPVNAIPGQAFHSQDSAGAGPVQSVGVGHIGVGHIGVGHIGVGHIGIGHIGIGHIGVGHIALVDGALRNVLLSDLPIVSPHGCADANSTTPCTGWPGVLAGTGLEFAPTQNVTMLQVLQDATARARFESLDLSDIDFSHSSLANLPFAAVALGGLPLSHLALDPSRGATPLAQWCSVLATPSVGLNCLGDLGIDLANPAPSDDDVTLMTIALAGANFDALPLDEIVVTGTISVGATPANVLGDSPLGVASINDLDLGAAGIGHIGVGHIGVGHIGVGHIGIGHIALDTIGVGHIGLNESGVGHIDLDAAGVGHIGVGHIGVGHIGVGHIGVGHISLGSSATGATGVGHIGVGHIDLAQSGVGQIALADLSDPSAVIDCSNATVFDCSIGTQTLSDVPPLLLHGTLWDLFQVLAPTSPSFTAFQNLTIADLIDALLPNTTEGDTITLTELIGSLLVDSATTIAELVANSTAAQAVELGTLLNGITVDKQNETTLGQLLGAITDPAVAATTLAELLSVIANDLGITLQDLLIGLLGSADLPWEQLDLSAVSLQSSAQPAGTPVNYHATLVVTDDGAGSLQDVVATATIPDDFVYKPSSSVFTLGGGSASSLPDPTPSSSPNGPVLTWTLPGLAAGTHSLDFQLLAGISEGSAAVAAEAHLRNGSAGTPVSATTAVADTQASTNPASPVPMNPDTLYLGHIDAQHASNFFQLHITGTQRASLLLGNLPSDYDLILYDATAAPHLRGTPSRSVIPVNDPPPTLSTIQQPLPPEALQDLPLVSGARVYDASYQRGFKDEQIDTGTLAPGDYLVQVAGYNGASSSLPYSLRARVVDDPTASCARDDTAFANRFAFPNDTAPAFSPPAPNGAVDTVLLMNPTRLAQTYGAGRAQQVIDALGPFMTAYQHAQLVRLDDAPMTALYDAWDRDPCSVDAANSIVQAIGQRLDGLLAGNPALRFVVIVGPDDQVPMGRVRDATRIANERGRAGDFTTANELTSALSGGYLLTDDAYSQQHPLAVGGRDLFVPDLQVGRLVETPEQQAKALNDFTAAHGVLPSSATSLATGYDFLKDGAQSVAAALSSGGHNPSTLINDTWTRDDLARALMGADQAGQASDPANPVPAIASVNAHFDEQNILPAIGNANHDQSALFTVDDAAAAGSRGSGTTLQGRLLFSMGCHSGLNLPDTVFGANANTNDWAEFMASQGALWVANTGYGYGDTDTVALSEKLMALLADQLDHSSTIGEALTIAKQRYAAGLAVVSPYDEKALMESTFYGLPMWSLPSPTTPGAALDRPNASAPSDFNPSVRTASINESFTVGGTGSHALQFASSDNTALDGHYAIGGQTQVAPQRPVQPRFEVDVTPNPAVDPALNGLVAKGALLTSLRSRDTAGVKPDLFRATVDQGGNEKTQLVGDSTFPAGIQTVTSYGRGNGLEQRLVLVPGQFKPTPGLAQPGRGTQRLFTSTGGVVYYGSPNDPDNVAPTILTSSATVSGQTVTVTARVVDAGTGSGGIGRVVALVTQAGAGAGTWTLVNMHPSASPSDPAGTYVGTFAGLPSAGNPVDAYFQAADMSGNVGVSALKGAYFNAQNLTSQGPLKFGFDSPSPPGANGWWRDRVDITITAPSITRTRLITYSLDGGPDVTSPTPGFASLSIPQGSEGVHVLVASQPGQQSSSVQVLVDRSAPIPAIGAPNPLNPADPNGPTQSEAGWYKDNPHLTSIVPTDPNTFGSGVDTITYSASGASTIATKTASEPPVGDPPVTESLTHDGVTTFNISAKDRAGNVALAGQFPVGIDSVAPSATIVADPPQNANGWHNSPPTLTITATDAARSSGIAQVVYTVNNGVEHDTIGTAVPVAGNPTAGATLVVDPFSVNEGRNVVRFQVTDAAGNDSPLYTVNVNVDQTPPNSTASVQPAENAAGWERVNTVVTFSGTDPAGPDGRPGSGVAKVTYSATNDAVKGGAVIPSTAVTDTSASTTLSTEGITTFHFFATDSADNVESTVQTRVVKLDKAPPTINLSLPPSNANAPVGPQANDPATGSPIKVYLLGQTPVRVTYSCSDAMSGLVNCTGSDGAIAKATNAQLDTNTIGLHTFTVQSTDVAGNPSTKTFQYRVVYNLCLKYDPTQAKNITSTVTLALQVCNAQLTNLSSSSIVLTGVAADNNGMLLSPNGPGGSNPNFKFTFDSKSKTYSYNLKTDSRYVKAPAKNWLNFRISTDPVTTTGSATDQTYLNKLYRAYFLLK